MIRENRPRLHQCSSNLKKDFQKKSNFENDLKVWWPLVSFTVGNVLPVYRFGGRLRCILDGNLYQKMKQFCNIRFSRG